MVAALCGGWLGVKLGKNVRKAMDDKDYESSSEDCRRTAGSLRIKSEVKDNVILRQYDNILICINMPRKK